MNKHYDVAIIGSGFSGSILAWILASRGRSIALIDPAKHPRFAIGESSTPIADLLLRRLGERYELPEFVSLSTHGSWQASHPEIACGRKRGFSYYLHHPRQEFDESELHERSLLVAASASDPLSDTHWYRRDVDQFLFTKAVAAGATDLSGHRVQGLQIDTPHRLTVSDHPPITSDWIVDASGRAGVTARLLGQPSLVSRLQTDTRSRYAHYRGVDSWHETLCSRGLTADDPFNTDDAAQHHLLGKHWLWMLRLNNGITSVGWTGPSDQSFDRQYASIEKLLARAELVEPSGGPIMTDRLQRLLDPVAARRCVMLPATACTIDPLHSTGIAHALSGVSRLAEIILGGVHEADAMEDYRRAILDEAAMLDLLVGTAYQTMDDFPKFVAACSLYFVLAIATEETILEGVMPSRFWKADKQTRALVRGWCTRLLSEDTEKAIETIRAETAPWNNAGLLEPAARNRYAYTATKV